MTKSQEKALKHIKAYDSYRNHYMKNKNLVIECETETDDMRIPYILVIGVRGGKTHLQNIGGEWKVV
jgi:hypothetical protein